MALLILPWRLILFWVQIIELLQFDLILDTQVGEGEVVVGKLHRMSLPIPQLLKAEAISQQKKLANDRVICIVAIA